MIKTLYGDVDYIEERHRHRYEVNPDVVEKFEQNGMRFVGRDDGGTRMEILELDGKFIKVNKAKGVLVY